MVLLRKEQIKERVSKVIDHVADELVLHKGNATGGAGKIMPEDFSLNSFKPYSVGQQFTAEDIFKKLQKAFNDNGLKEIRFEFGIISFARNGIENSVTQQSSKFAEFYED